MRLLSFAALGLLTAFILSSCGQMKPEESCGFVQNVYGQRISWKGSLPVPLYVHSSYPAQYYPALDQAIQVWETALGRKLFKVVNYSLGGPIDPRRDGNNVIYWMSSWEANKVNEQARTSVHWEGDQIRETDIRINAYNKSTGQGFNFYIDYPLNSSDVHLPSLLIHELGHVLGLKHNDSGTSVMATYLQAQMLRNKVGDTDVKSARCEY